MAKVLTVLSVLRIVVVEWLRHRLGWHAVRTREPPPEVRHLAALAAERTPRRVHRLTPAVDADCCGGAQNPLIVFGNLEMWESVNLVRVVSDVARGDHEDHIFGDVR